MRRWVAELPEVRADQIAVIGHSRMGKAALWAGAQDEGFAAVLSNNSGCAGAGLSRHPAGEDIAAITSRFGYWFTPRFATYSGRPQDLPVDQHLLLSAIAPRLVYVGSGADDLWADPVGEFLSVAAAQEIHRLLGSRVGYHLRPGGHGLTPEDWSHYLVFLRHYLDR